MLLGGVSREDVIWLMGRHSSLEVYQLVVWMEIDKEDSLDLT